jgi:hypothetical protein
MMLVDIKPGMTVIKSKYVFKIKKKFGKFSRHKARLVAHGHDQEVNPQFNFSPVVKPNTMRMLMVLAQVCKYCFTKLISVVQISRRSTHTCTEGNVHT